MSGSTPTLRPGTVVRDRLASLLAADPLLAPTDGVTDAPFPHPILKIDPTTVSAERDIEICLLVPGMNIRDYTLGGRGVGKADIRTHLVAAVYVANVADADAAGMDADELAAAKGARSTLCGSLVTLLAEAILHYQVDPTPGDQWWNILKFEPGPHEMDITFHENPTFFAAHLRLVIHGQQRKT